MNGNPYGLILQTSPDQTNNTLRVLAGVVGLISANIIAHEIIHIYPNIDVFIPGLFASASMTYLLADNGNLWTVAMVTAAFTAIYYMFIKKQTKYKKTLPPQIPLNLERPRHLERPISENEIKPQEPLVKLDSLATMADLTFTAFGS
jgi:hypothetical protein